MVKNRNTNNIATLFEYKNGMELVCANSYKKCCYPVLVGLMVDYEEQVLVTGIKANMQYLICHML